MKKILKKIMIIIVTLFLLLLVWVLIEWGANSKGIVLPWHKQNAIATTLKWGGLHILPKDAKNIKISTEGEMFSRSFTLTFKSSKENILTWCKESLSLKTLTPDINNSNVIKYIVPIGKDGSIGGWVEISVESWYVKIYMAWS